MRKAHDPNFLKNDQYKNAANLNARIYLHAQFSTNKYGWHQFVFDFFAPLPPNARVLEVGCGPGTLWVQNADRIPADWDITLTDFSDGMLQDAQENLKAIQHPIKYQIANAMELPFEDATFDAVIANHMLYHVPDRPKALSEFRRILKPGGWLFAATNGDNHLSEIEQMVFKLDPDNPNNVSKMRQNAVDFGFETGQTQLDAFFSDVQLHRYEDALEVTQAAPLINYLGSMTSKPLKSKQVRALTDQITQSLIRDGSIHITKETGLFVARKPS